MLEFPDAQRIEPKAAVSAAWAARMGKQWLLVNADETDGAWQEGPGVELSAIPELPGYILNGTQIVDATGSDALATMCLKVPVLGGRDLNDVVIETRNAEEWVRVGSNWSRPFESIPTLGVGSSIVTIGTEAYAEWRKLSAAGTVTLTGASAWKLYDDKFALQSSSNATGAVALPGTGAASYLLLFGAAGTAISVKVA